MTKEKTILGAVGKIGADQVLDTNGETSFDKIGNNIFGDTNGVFNLYSYHDQDDNGNYYEETSSAHEKQQYEKVLYTAAPHFVDTQIEEYISKKKAIAQDTSLSDSERASQIENLDNTFQEIMKNIAPSYSEFLEKYYYTTTNFLSIQSIEALQNYMSASSNMIIGATFRTALDDVQQYSASANYGISFGVEYKNATTGEYQFVDYTLDVNSMSGSPYSLLNATRQYKIVPIKSNFVQLLYVYIWTEDFPNIDNTKAADIFVSNVELTCANQISTEDLQGTYLHILTPQGTWFTKKDATEENLTLQGELLVKGNAVSSTSEDVTWYWFFEDASINNKSFLYQKDGGKGWRCLNDYDTITLDNGTEDDTSDDSQVAEFKAGSSEQIVNEKAFLCHSLKYKCVAVYDSQVFEATVNIINPYNTLDLGILVREDSLNVNTTLTDENNSITFYKDNGKPILNCLVEDSSGNLINCVLDENGFPQYSTTANGQTFSYSWSQQTYDGEKSSLGSESTETIEVQAITNFTYQTCSARQTDGSTESFIGSLQIKVVNSFEDELDIDTPAQSLLITNGTQTYIYDEDGLSPTSENREKPITIKTLSFRIQDKDGNVFDSNEDYDIQDADLVASCQILWEVPLSNTMLSFNDIVLVNKDGTALSSDATVGYQSGYVLPYTLKDTYSYSNTDNTIKLTVVYNNYSLIAQTSLVIVKTGDPGTNGTDNVAAILANADNRPLQPMITTQTDTNVKTPNQILGSSGGLFVVNFFYAAEQLQCGNAFSATDDIYAKGLTTEWFSLQNTYKNSTTASISEKTSISENSNTEHYAPSINNYATCVDSSENFTIMNSKDDSVFELSANGVDCLADILECKITYEDVNYQATLPLITAQVTDSNYQIRLKDNTGFRFVTYGSDGRRPKQDSSSPFEIEIVQLNDSAVMSPSDYTYKWYVLGSMQNCSEKTWQPTIYLKYSYNEKYAANIKKFTPVDTYNGECVNCAIEVVVFKGETEFGRIHIPIHLLLNRYTNAALNDWDGNSISLDEDRGVILAPQIGAGKKETDNSFTGLLMGEVKEYGQDEADVGLIGYKEGTRTLHIDANEGQAIFGSKGNGQIIIDPNARNSGATSTLEGKALLYSSNFWNSYYDDTTSSSEDARKYNGLPQTTYEFDGEYDNQSGEGMIIDLTSPRIQFGNKTFSVSPKGLITAASGDIGNWILEKGRLYQENGKVATGISSISSTGISDGSVTYGNFTQWNENSVTATQVEVTTKVATTTITDSDNNSTTTEKEVGMTVAAIAEESKEDKVLDDIATISAAWGKTSGEQNSFVTLESNLFDIDTDGFTIESLVKIAHAALKCRTGLDLVDKLQNEIKTVKANLNSSSESASDTSDSSSSTTEVIEEEYTNTTFDTILGYITSIKNVCFRIANALNYIKAEILIDENLSAADLIDTSFNSINILFEEIKEVESIISEAQVRPTLDMLQEEHNYDNSASIETGTTTDESTGTTTTVTVSENTEKTTKTVYSVSLTQSVIKPVAFFAGGTIEEVSEEDGDILSEVETEDEDGNIVTEVNKIQGHKLTDYSFVVTHDGYLLAKEASIGSGSNPIYIGKSANAVHGIGSSVWETVDNSKRVSAIFSGKKNFLYSNEDGFYLGEDGFSLSSQTGSSIILNLDTDDAVDVVTDDDSSSTGASTTEGGNSGVTISAVSRTRPAIAFSSTGNAYITRASLGDGFYGFALGSNQIKGFDYSDQTALANMTDATAISKSSLIDCLSNGMFLSPQGFSLGRGQINTDDQTVQYPVLFFNEAIKKGTRVRDTGEATDEYGEDSKVCAVGRDSSQEFVYGQVLLASGSIGGWDFRPAEGITSTKQKWNGSAGEKFMKKKSTSSDSSVSDQSQDTTPEWQTSGGRVRFTAGIFPRLKQVSLKDNSKQSAVRVCAGRLVGATLSGSGGKQFKENIAPFQLLDDGSLYSKQSDITGCFRTSTDENCTYDGEKGNYFGPEGLRIGNQKIDKAGYTSEECTLTNIDFTDEGFNLTVLLGDGKTLVTNTFIVTEKDGSIQKIYNSTANYTINVTQPDSDSTTTS